MRHATGELADCLHLLRLAKLRLDAAHRELQEATLETRAVLAQAQISLGELVRLTPGAPHTPAPEQCQMWICVAGRGAIAGEPFQPGEVWLFPEAVEQPTLLAETSARFLRTYVPR